MKCPIATCPLMAVQVDLSMAEAATTTVDLVDLSMVEEATITEDLLMAEVGQDDLSVDHILDPIWGMRRL